MSQLDGADRREPDRLISRTHNQSMHEDDGLALVLEEVRHLMEGCGAFLTLQPSGDERGQLLYLDRGAARHDHAALLKLSSATEQGFDDGTPVWRTGLAGTEMDLLLMPVERTGNHGRLVIGMLLDAPTDDARQRAELLYRERRPFAVGYFHLWQRSRLMDQRAASFEAVLDQAAIGVLLLNWSSEVIYTNRTAEEILTAGDGLSRNRGKLRATRLSDGVNLQAALSHALTSKVSASAGSVGHPLFALRREVGQPLVAALVPSANPLIEPTDVAATMYLVDPDRNIASMLAPVCRLYGLSPVETTLACHLASGVTVADASAAMRVKEATSRGYLKSIFAKTATGKQTELIVLLLSSIIQIKTSDTQQVMALAARGS